MFRTRNIFPNDTSTTGSRITYKQIHRELKGGLGDSSPLTIKKLVKSIAGNHARLVTTQEPLPDSNTAIARLNLERLTEADYCKTDAQISYSIAKLTKGMNKIQESLFIHELAEFLNTVNENQRLDELNKRLDFIEALGYIKNNDINAIPEPSYFLRNYNDHALQEALPEFLKLVKEDKLAEGIGLLRYSIADAEFKAVADNAAKAFENTFSFKGRVVAFLRKLHHSEQRNANEGIFFINKLRELKNAKNPDGSSVKGVERIFQNAEEILLEGKDISGFIFEANLACTLIDAGFNVREVSVRENADGKKLISSDGLEREIDIIAEKEFDGCNLTFYIEAKSSIDDLISSDKKNGQLSALIELAERHKPSAQPVVMLKSRISILSNHGDLKRTELREFNRTETEKIKLCLSAHRGRALIWREPLKEISEIDDTDELNIVSKKELQAFTLNSNKRKSRLLSA